MASGRGAIHRATVNSVHQARASSEHSAPTGNVSRLVAPSSKLLCALGPPESVQLPKPWFDQAQSSRSMGHTAIGILVGDDNHNLLTAKCRDSGGFFYPPEDPPVREEDDQRSSLLVAPGSRRHGIYAYGSPGFSWRAWLCLLGSLPRSLTWDQPGTSLTWRR